VIVVRVPGYIGIITYGNRGWAEANKMTKEKGYKCGIDPGLRLLKLSKEAGIKALMSI
jgi:undecaprenyl diphosphate synthase